MAACVYLFVCMSDCLQNKLKSYGQTQGTDHLILVVIQISVRIREFL